ncbi:MAG TPA: glycosyltransferase family 1 protein [Pyrinomonadaceae bacterium]|nr:glycosyltransferase family 1 protein [Pyrinomonadaceae bacterium]
MHIILDARAARPELTGIGRATLGLIRGLRAADHDHLITLLCDPACRPALDELRVDHDGRFRLAVVPVGPFSFARQLTLAWRIRPLRADLWHAPYYVRPLLGVPPAVVTAYDLIRPGEGPPGPRRRVAAAPALKWSIKMRLSLTLAAHVITPSQATKEDIRKSLGIPARRLSVVALAADEHFRPPPARLVEDVRRRYGLGNRYVVYLGTNKPHKNIDSLVAAWGELAREGVTGSGDGAAALVIAGREDPKCPSSRRRYAGLAPGLRLRFLRDVPDADLPALLGGALCFVSPSLKEGFNLTPLEAMACGAPVLAADRPSTLEVVGDAALLVEPDATALASGLGRLLADDGLRRELSRRGRARAAEFSWRRTAEETIRVYERVAGVRGAAR